jgi:hypothetical protein
MSSANLLIGYQQDRQMVIPGMKGFNGTVNAEMQAIKKLKPID